MEDISFSDHAEGYLLPAAPSLCSLPFSCVDYHAELVLIVLARCFHCSLAAGLHFDHFSPAVSILVLIHHEEVRDIYALLASNRIAIGYLHSLAGPLYDVRVVVAEGHEAPFPAAPVCGGLGPNILVRVLERVFALCELAHEPMFLVTYPLVWGAAA